jgi:hypothetical protein
MGDKMRSFRCATKKCSGFINATPSLATRTPEGNWQFECSICHYWNLVASSGTVTATSREPFELDRLPAHLRQPFSGKREPPGGI